MTKAVKSLWKEILIFEIVMGYHMSMVDNFKEKLFLLLNTVANHFLQDDKIARDIVYCSLIRKIDRQAIE